MGIMVTLLVAQQHVVACDGANRYILLLKKKARSLELGLIHTLVCHLEASHIHTLVLFHLTVTKTKSTFSKMNILTTTKIKSIL